ncbi:MAG: hypothetical protein NXI03_06110 [Alphaproteobacteria bacterium]|nr:hypothetical protein [Alphaproteobacteria bacterium]
MNLSASTVISRIPINHPPATGAQTETSMNQVQRTYRLDGTTYWSFARMRAQGSQITR